jgi:hypothetical protein
MAARRVRRANRAAPQLHQPAALSAVIRTQLSSM